MTGEGPSDVTDLHLVGYRLSIRKWLPPSAPNLVFVVVHGYGEHSARYDWLARRIRDDGNATISVDLPGHGLSSGERGVLPSFTELFDVIDALRMRAQHHWEMAPHILIGHSLGGLIAAGYAVTRGDDLPALVLSSPVLGQWNAIDAFLPLDEIPASHVRARHLSALPEFAEDYDKDPLIWRGPMSRETLLNAREQLRSLASMSRPLRSHKTLWLHGGMDRIVPVGPTMAALAELGPPDLLARVFPSALHEVFSDTVRHEAFELLRYFAKNACGGRDITDQLNEEDPK